MQEGTKVYKLECPVSGHPPPMIMWKKVPPPSPFFRQNRKRNSNLLNSTGYPTFFLPPQCKTEMVFEDGEMIGAGWTRFRKQQRDRVLRIKNIRVADSGSYLCEAVNGFGRRVVEFTLIVYG